MIEKAVSTDINNIINELGVYIENNESIDEFTLKRYQSRIDKITDLEAHYILKGLYYCVKKEYECCSSCFDEAIKYFGLQYQLVKNYDFCLSKSFNQFKRKENLFDLALKIESPGFLGDALHKAYELSDIDSMEKFLFVLSKIENGIDNNEIHELITIVRNYLPELKEIYQLVNITNDDVKLMVDFVLCFLCNQKIHYYATQFQLCDNDLFDINFLIKNISYSKIDDLNSILLDEILDNEALSNIAWKVTPRLSVSK